jgi:hypothetical protein
MTRFTGSPAGRRSHVVKQKLAGTQRPGSPGTAASLRNIGGARDRASRVRSADDFNLF